MGHVRGHLPQIGQAIFARQLAIFRFQLVGEAAHFLPQRVVRLLQPQRGAVPGRQHGVQIGIGVELFRFDIETGMSHGGGKRVDNRCVSGRVLS